MGQVGQHGRQILFALLEQIRHHEDFYRVHLQGGELGLVLAPPMPSSPQRDGRRNGLGEVVVAPEEDQMDAGGGQSAEIFGALPQDLVTEMSAMDLEAVGLGAPEAGLGGSAFHELLGEHQTVLEDLGFTGDVGMRVEEIGQQLATAAARGHDHEAGRWLPPPSTQPEDIHTTGMGPDPGVPGGEWVAGAHPFDSLSSTPGSHRQNPTGALSRVLEMNGARHRRSESTAGGHRHGDPASVAFDVSLASGCQSRRRDATETSDAREFRPSTS
jgi:hypothetical protein